MQPRQRDPPKPSPVTCESTPSPEVATLSAERRRGPLHTQGAQRLAFPSHDGGQTLYIFEGLGLARVCGQQIVELNPGDVVFAPHGQRTQDLCDRARYLTLLIRYDGEAVADGCAPGEATRR